MFGIIGEKTLAFLSQWGAPMSIEIGFTDELSISQYSRLAVLCAHYHQNQTLLSCVLDALTLKQIEQIRQGAAAMWYTHSQTRIHEWRGFHWLDFDFSGLPCSPRGEESQKGYFISGRRLVRVSAIKFRETILSDLYPGNRHIVNCLQPAVPAAENASELAPGQRKYTVLRINSAGGNDAHLHWIPDGDDHIMTFGMANRRTTTQSGCVPRWVEYQDVLLGEVELTIDFGRMCE